jgi:hypothetical protein
MDVILPLPLHWILLICSVTIFMPVLKI